MNFTVNSALVRGYTLEEWDKALLLIRQTLDILSSGDRPGRYFDVDAPWESTTAYGRRGGWKRGERMGGRWRSVKSMRKMLGWFGGTRFTPDDLRRALRLKGKLFLRNRVLRSAAAFVRNERKWSK